MRVPFYDIKAQYDELSHELDRVVHEVISSGAYMMGAHCRGLEEELAALHEVKHCISLNSGTDALRIIMDAAEIGPGDEVVSTAFTFVASAETIVQTGASPVFVDIEPVTFNIDAGQIEAAITPRTKAIMPVHLFGQMCDMETINDIAQRHNLVVIEDAAQAVGSTRNGKPAGNFGIGAGLSFYVTKNLGAAGDAGAILTNDDAIAERCRSIRVHGMGRERYYYDYVGYTSRMDEVQAAVLRIKLNRLRQWNERRARIAEMYCEQLVGSGIPTPQTQPGNNNTWHQFSVRVQKRPEVMARMKEAGVDTMIYYPVPLHFHKPYERFNRHALPETEKAASEIMNLPMHPHLSDAQAVHVAESLLNATKGA
ncbi:MAG TPA: DegT/DnrJ/EryC1/StrS family aminotransferase [Fimbriimonas sp.]|nr:DegT/DnrJ/EryC1/StrS family aminotransferase [Fimbriimonas sp.]